MHAGEILGIAGVDGNGQSELVEVLTRLRRAEQGEVLVSGRNITNLSRQVRSAGRGWPIFPRIATARGSVPI